jgi:hypothetical protein
MAQASTWSEHRSAEHIVKQHVKAKPRPAHGRNRVQAVHKAA